MLPGPSDLCTEVALSSCQAAAAPGVLGCLRSVRQGPGEGAARPRPTVPPQKHLCPQRVHQTEPPRSGSVFNLGVFFVLKPDGSCNQTSLCKKTTAAVQGK